MKKYNKLVMMAVGAFALLAFPSVVSAATTFQLNCDQPAKAGNSFTCSLSVNSTEGVNSMKVQILPDSQLTLDRVTYDGKNWTQGDTDSNGYVTLSTMTNPVNTGTIATIDATWKENAVECGKLCISILYTIAGSTSELPGTATGDFVSTGTCSVKKTTTTKTESPNTGRFSDYAVLVGGAAIAIAAISVARRSTKFYRV